MSIDNQLRHSRRARRRARKSVAKRSWFWLIVVLVLVIIAAGVWIGVRGLQAKKDLDAAMPLAKTAKAQLLAQDVSGATATIDQLTPKVEDAKRLTSDPVWRIAELVPVLGGNLSAVRKIADATDGVINGAVKPLVGVASTLDPKSFKPVNGAINTAPLVAAAPVVKKADASVQAALAQVKSIDTGSTIGQVTAAKTKFLGLLDEVAPTLTTLNTVVPLLPGVLGVDGPRNYVVLFQNSAEMRALGGTALSSALVSVNKGAISLVRIATAVNYTHYGASVIPVPDGVLQLYKDSFGTFIANSTVRPSFTSTAEMTQVMWKDQFGVNVDGVISIDPTALSYLLRATGPIPLASGDTLTSANLVQFLLNEVYLRYPKDNDLQDALYSEAVFATFARLSSGQVDPKALLAALTQGWNERRVLFWSAHKPEQAELAKAGLNGELPVSDSNTDRVGVYFQDGIGSKMDYYLKQAVTLASGTCRADGKQTYRVTVDMTNGVPADAGTSLGRSIIGNAEREGVIPGYQRVILMLYAPPGSTIEGATVGGASVPLEAFHDTSYPVAKISTDFAPGATQTVTFDVVAGKAGKRALDAQITPLVSPTKVTKANLDCATVKEK
jgi:hypothetical protein